MSPFPYVCFPLPLSAFLSPSVCLPLPLSLYLSFSLSTNVSVLSFSLCLGVSVTVSDCLYLCFCHPLTSFHTVCLPLSFCLSRYLYASIYLYKNYVSLSLPSSATPSVFVCLPLPLHLTASVSLFPPLPPSISLPIQLSPSFFLSP